MASVEKMWESLVGYQTGLHGPKPTTLPYRVTVDAVDDNPVDVIKLDGTGVPIGTAHPLDDSLVVVDYLIQDRINLLNWRIDPIYKTDSVWTKLHPVNDGWALDWQSTTETYPLHHTVEPIVKQRKGIGIPLYRVPTKKEIEGDNARILLYTIEGAPVGKNKLVREEKRFVPEPFNRAAPLISFSLTRRFALLNPDAVSAAITYLRKVNVDVFPYVRGRRYTVRFDSISGRAVPSAAPGTEHGVEWELRLDFTYNPEGMTPIRRFHMWIDDETGAQSFILDRRGNRMEEEFEVYELANMGQLLSNFG